MLLPREGISVGDPDERPSFYKGVGIGLAIGSGVFIGTSFVLKKVGLLKANEKYKEVAGEGYGYLRNGYWWGGMTLMIIGEICNFVAYAFTDAILVTPLGALSVVITTVLSAIFLKERLSMVGKVSCFLCIVGSVVIVMNAPANSAVRDIQEMQDYVIAPGFLTFTGLIIVGSAFTAFWVAPRWGSKNMLVYISICSWVGGLSVVATQGLGAAIIAWIGGKPQYKEWFMWVLFVFVIGTLMVEIVYLNVSSLVSSWTGGQGLIYDTESIKSFQRRPRHTDLLCLFHKYHDHNVSHSLPRFQRNSRADRERRPWFSHHLLWCRSSPTLESCERHPGRRGFHR